MRNKKVYEKFESDISLHSYIYLYSNNLIKEKSFYSRM